MEIRKLYIIVEETHAELKKLDAPVRKAAVAAVIKNPYAGRYSEDLEELFAAGEELGSLLTRRAKEALGITTEQVHSFGKAVIVGEGGELEHAAAIMHPRLGKPVRDEVNGVAIIPSAKKHGGMGTAIDVPLHYKDAMRVRSHFDAMEVRVPDAPAGDELVAIIAITDSGRPFPRVGGLKLEDVKGEDGLV